MPRSANQKLKLLCLCKILWERTDEEHPLTVPELIQALEAWDIRAERKSIYDDMEALRTFGLDVQNRKGKAPGWFLGERPFQLAELKLLVDAVQSSRFITQRKSRELIRKLEAQASAHQATQLQRQVYVDRRVKTMNESVYYTIDKLHTAIANRKVVTFKYFEYNVRKEKVFRREVMLVPDGEEHFTVTVPAVVSPQFLGWVFGLGDGVQILRPGWAAEEMKKQLAAAAALYG